MSLRGFLIVAGQSPQYAAGLNLNSPERALPRRAAQLESLRDVLREVQWEEDKTRSGNWALNACLAILRVAFISVKFRQEVTLPWPRIFEQCAHSTVPAISLINGKSIK